MIRFLNDKTIAGDRYGMGAIAQFDAATELELIAEGAAIICPIPTMIGQSYAGWTRSSTNGVVTNDTDYQTLASEILPAGTMGLNSKLVIIPDWDYPASASRKYLSVDFGVTNISAVDIYSLPTYRMGKILLEVQNLNSLTSQKTMNGSSYGVSANARISSTINTANTVTIAFKCAWGANVASEAITLLGYSIWHYPGA